MTRPTINALEWRHYGASNSFFYKYVLTVELFFQRVSWTYCWSKWNTIVRETTEFATCSALLTKPYLSSAFSNPSQYRSSKKDELRNYGAAEIPVLQQQPTSTDTAGRVVR